MVRSAVRLTDFYVKKATKSFTVRIVENIPRVKVNAQKLEQVLMNLIQNACQALTGKKQSIELSSSCDEKRSTVFIVVRDEGAGIHPDDLKRVKEPFFTTKRGEGGTGLGLYVCDGIVTLHGGTLNIASVLGEGTTVTVSLPAEVKDEH